MEPQTPGFSFMATGTAQGLSLGHCGAGQARPRLAPEATEVY